MIHNETREQALHSIGDIARRHDLSLDEIGAVLMRDGARSKGASYAVRLLGYIGAALILGGLSLWISMQWDMIGSAARVVVTYGAGLTAFVMASIFLTDVRYARASTPLVTFSAFMQPFGLFVFLNEYMKGDDTYMAGIVVFGAMAVQFLASFFVAGRTAHLFFGGLFFYGAMGLLLGRLEVPDTLAGICLALSALMAASQIDRTKHRGICPFWYVVAGIGLMWSVFDWLEGSAFDALMIVVPAGLMALSVRLRSRSLLFVSAAGFLGHLGYYTDEYFKDALGWPVALMMMGVALIGVAAFALRLGRRMGASSAA